MARSKRDAAVHATHVDASDPRVEHDRIKAEPRYRKVEGVDPRMRQRTDALAKAQKIRLAKAELKRSWVGRDAPDVMREVAGLLEDPSCTQLESFKLSELLTTIPGIGKTKARDIAHAAEWIELTHRVGRLTARQRELVARVLRQRAENTEARRVAA